MKCWVGDCNHHQTRDKCKYFTIPLTPLRRRRNAWKAAIGNGSSPPVHARICSCHFKNGRKDEGPTIFKRQRNPKFQHMWVSPKIKTRKPSRTPVFEVDNADEDDPVPLESFGTPKRLSSAILRTPDTTKMSSHSIQSPSGVWEVNSENGIQLLDSSDIGISNATESHSHCKKALFLKEKNCDVCTKEPCQCKEEVAKLRKFLAESRQIISELHRKHCTAEDVRKQLESSIVLLKDHLLFPSMDDDKIRHYTGLPNKGTFLWVLSLFSKPLNYYECNSAVVSVSKENQLLLTLVKLRHAVTHQILGDWFRVSESTVTRIVRTWVSALHTVLFKSAMKNIPSRHKNKKSLPECFAPYSNCRIVIDCTELRVQVPDAMKSKNLVHSFYKGYSTAKGAVGVAPNGTITFVSDLYPGSNSDKTIMYECGILDKLQPGDLILADKGFLIHDMLPPGVTLNIPPFKNTAQFTATQVRSTTSIARARIHVERANARIKEYQILDCIPANMFSYASQLFQTCCALTNLKNPLIAEVEDEMRLWQWSLCTYQSFCIIILKLLTCLFFDKFF